MNKDNNFKLNYNIKTYKGFVNYFFNLEYKEKDIIVKECFKYVKNNYKPQNKTMYKIYEMYKILLHKLKYDKLNIKERFIYEYINAYLIYNNLFENNLLFEKYCNTYLNNITLDNIECKIKLIIQDVINTFNKEYLLDVKLTNEISDFDNDILGCVHWNDLKQEIVIYDDVYDIEVNNDNLISTISELIFITSHEYKHVIQKLDCYYTNNHFNKMSFEDFCLRALFYKFYDKYHDYFETEKDADLFALEKLEDLLLKYRSKDKKLKTYNFKRNLLLKIIGTFNIENESIKSYKKLLDKSPSDTYDVII